jgi:hypothetical protein
MNTNDPDYGKSVGCHLKASEVRALHQLAEMEQRSVAGMTHELIRAALIARGVLRPVRDDE